MTKLLFLLLTIGVLTTSCIPVQLVDQQYNEYHNHVEVVVVEQPVFIAPPPPVHPRPPIYLPVEKPRRDTIKPVRTTPEKRSTTPIQPVRSLPKGKAGTVDKSGKVEKTNTIQRKRKE